MENKMAIKYYKGDRIYLRPIEMSDEISLRQWINDPDVWQTLTRCFPTNELREREYIEKLSADTNNVVFGIALEDGNKLIGSCGLHNITSTHRCAMFGILIGEEDDRSRGYGKEATELTLKLGFEEYNLNRIELDVLGTNTRAIRAYERAGFKREGCLREAYFRGGRYVDVLHYGFLQTEWSRKRTMDEEAEEIDDEPVTLAAMSV